MADDATKAGGISFELRAEFENLATGLLQAQEQFKSFSDSVSASATKLQTGSSGVSKGFENVSKASDLMSAGALRATTRLIGVQIALQSLITGSGNVGAIKELLQGLSNGFSTASASMHIFGNNISTLGAGIIGVAVAAISVFTRHLEEVIKLTNQVTDAQLKAQVSINSYATALKDADAKANAFRLTIGERMAQAFRVSESAFDGNLKKLRDLLAEMEKIRAKIAEEAGGGLSDQEMAHFSDPLTQKEIFKRNKTILDVDVIQKLIEQLGVLQNEYGRLSQQQEDIAAKAPWGKAQEEMAKLADAAQKVRQEFADIGVVGERALKLGVISPAEEAERRLVAAKKVLDQYLADDAKLIEIASQFAPGSPEQREILAKLHSNTDYGKAKADLDQSEANKERFDRLARDTKSYADGLSHSIGDAVAQGILNGEKAMQILSDVGRNLFSNMLQDVVKKFQTGMEDVFKYLGEQVSPEFGASLGAALTGILGVVGGIFSRGRSGTQHFSQIQSGIQSSEVVRGIVAGPTSVSIAALGNDLQRANQPLVERLDRVITILGAIAQKGGGGDSYGGPSYVSVPTG